MQSNCRQQKNTQVAQPMEGRLVMEETRKYIIMTYGFVITSCSVMTRIQMDSQMRTSVTRMALVTLP